jgi:molybdopterin-guanine dinucleotide biosynthesis protein B
MKVFAVSGLHGTGKTTVMEHLVKELTSRGLNVGTIKDIHYEGFSMDKEGTNTWRHMQAGACMVAARGLRETDFLVPSRMAMSEIVRRFDADVVIIEGGHEEDYPRITCAMMPEDADLRIDGRTFAISGCIAECMGEYRGFRVFNCLSEGGSLADLALAYALELSSKGSTI